MDRTWLYKFLLIVALVLAASWVLAPTAIYFSMPPDQRGNDEAFQKRVPDWLPKKHLSLGLDLQGGIHLVMGVEVDKAVMDAAGRRADELARYAKEHDVPLESSTADLKDPQVKVKLAPDKVDQFEKVVLKDAFQDMNVVSDKDGTLTLAFKAEKVKQIRENAVDQAVKTIRNRVDQWGVTEPQIAKRGEDQVLIQLPGVKDPDRAKDLLGKTAQLEFKIVQDDKTGFIKEHFGPLQTDGKIPTEVALETEQGAGPGGTPVDAYYLKSANRRDLEKARDALQPFLPEGTMLAFEKMDQGQGTKATYRTWLLTRTAPLTGDYLTDARVAFDQQKGGRPYVSLEFNQQGATIFEQLTEKNVHRRMAIVLDDTVSSAPVINEKIGGGRAMITLGGLKPYNEVLRDANDLALVLKAGALPAPVRILEERSVGATLGPDLIHRGITALIIGGLLVVVFMVIYYKVSGMVADVALAMNILFLLSILALFGATLTLPGLAGIVLTIGMAVDANVIIFERIREEVDVGKTARAAIDAGYDKAFSAILDGNLTTGIAAFVLLQYGTGPVRGFAVTLLAGIVSTLFCGVFVSRVIQEALNRRATGRVSV